MPDGILTFEHGEVRLGDTLIDGELSYIHIRGEVEFDEAREDGLSGTKKVAMGWKDSDIDITVVIISDEDATCYERLGIIDALFRGADEGKRPQVYTVTNVHARARGIDQVVFRGLISYETNRDDTLRAVMRFAEYEPAVVKIEKQVAASDKATETPETNTAADTDTLQISME